LGLDAIRQMQHSWELHIYIWYKRCKWNICFRGKDTKNPI